MTGQLRTTLHTRADDVPTGDLDLDAIVRAGDRRVRRRRRTALAGSLVGVLAVAGGVTALVKDHTTQVQPADQDVKQLTYAVGSVLHTGSGTVDVGKKVDAMVATRWGFVFSTPDDQVYAEQDGDVHQIGHLASHSKLFASDDGLVTAWWDGERIQTWPGYGSGKSGAVTAFDRTNSFGAARSWTHDDPPRVETLSDGHLWFWDGQDHRIAEIRPMETSAVWKDSNAVGSGTVVDAAGDWILVKTHDGMAVTTANLLPWPIGKQDGWHPGGDLTGLATQVKNVDYGDLAPDGRHWFTDENDEFAVYDSATGRRQDPAHPGFEFAAPYQWLNDDTMAVIAVPDADKGGPVSLLTCRVSTDDCRVAAADIGNYGDFAVPVGAEVAD